MSPPKSAGTVEVRTVVLTDKAMEALERMRSKREAIYKRPFTLAEVLNQLIQVGDACHAVAWGVEPILGGDVE